MSSVPDPANSSVTSDPYTTISGKRFLPVSECRFLRTLSPLVLLIQYFLHSAPERLLHLQNILYMILIQILWSRLPDLSLRFRSRTDPRAIPPLSQQANIYKDLLSERLNEIDRSLLTGQNLLCTLFRSSNMLDRLKMLSLYFYHAVCFEYSK